MRLLMHAWVKIYAGTGVGERGQRDSQMHAQHLVKYPFAFAFAVDS